MRYFLFSLCMMIGLLSTVPPASATAMDREDLGLFLKTEMGLNEIAKKYGGRPDHDCIWTSRSSFYECCFEEGWPSIEGYLLETRDSTLLKTFLDFVVCHDNSADEGISFTLGKIYFYRTSEIEPC